MAIIFVTHDLGVAAEIADRVAVMYAGRVVEEGAVGPFMGGPLHPYAQGLLGATVHPGMRGKRLTTIPGAPPGLDGADDLRLRAALRARRARLPRRCAAGAARRPGPDDALHQGARRVMPGVAKPCRNHRVAWRQARRRYGIPMRTITQVAVLAVLAGAGAGWHFYGDRVGLKPPLEMFGLARGRRRVAVAAAGRAVRSASSCSRCASPRWSSASRAWAPCARARR